MKFYLIKLEETNGEFEYSQYVRVEAINQKDAEKEGKRLAKTWYGGKAREDNGVYYFSNNIVAVSFVSAKEMTVSEFATISKFL